MNLDAAWAAIAHALPGYERRPQQEEMARRVEAAIGEPGHLAVEAGTGVGKSFAYLVPAMLRAAEHGDTVVVATRTIALQGQVLRDIPVLKRALGLEHLPVAIAKGRGNYVCRRRAEAALEAGPGQFRDEQEWRDLVNVVGWAEESEDGSLATLGFKPADAAWDAARAESGNCMGKECRFFEQCGYQRSRRELAAARIVVANHSLVAIDLAIRSRSRVEEDDEEDEEGDGEPRARDTRRGVLPPHNVLVLDEAHEFADAVRSAFDDSFGHWAVQRVLDRVWHPKRKTGLLKSIRSTPRVLSLLDAATGAKEALFANAAAYVPSFLRQRTVRSPGPFADPLSPALRDLADGIEELHGTVRTKEAKLEWKARLKDLRELADRVAGTLAMDRESYAHWIERGDTGHARICRSPVEVAPLLETPLWRNTPSVICTSATLRVGGSFAHFRRETGMPKAAELAAGSPFDFARQAALRIYPSMPDPRATDAYRAATVARVRELVNESKGGAFVLFTSKAEQDAVHRELAPEFRSAGLCVLRQGEVPNEEIVLRFKERADCVLFAVATFWQGVDIKGHNLRMVVICKLPFAVPGHPLAEAREEICKRRGGNPFVEISVPEVVLKVVQAFGRLIRSHEDRGVVAILDPRIVTKSYGKTVLASLPACPVEEVAHAAG